MTVTDQPDDDVAAAVMRSKSSGSQRRQATVQFAADVLFNTLQFRNQGNNTVYHLKKNLQNYISSLLRCVIMLSSTAQEADECTSMFWVGVYHFFQARHIGPKLIR